MKYTIPENIFLYLADYLEDEGETNETKKHEEDYTKIVIKLKNGETIVFDENEWDDFAYDMQFFIVKKDGAWIALYNCADVSSFELK